MRPISHPTVRLWYDMIKSTRYIGMRDVYRPAGPLECAIFGLAEYIETWQKQAPDAHQVEHLNEIGDNLYMFTVIPTKAHFRLKITALSDGRSYERLWFNAERVWHWTEV